MSAKKVRLDIDKIKAKAKENDTTLPEISLGLGYKENWISDNASKFGGEMSPLQAKAISLMLNTDVESLKWEEPKKVEDEKLADVISDLVIIVSEAKKKIGVIESNISKIADAIIQLGTAEQLADMIINKKKPKQLVEAEEMLERMFNTAGKRECQYNAFIYNCKSKYDNPPVDMLHQAIYNTGGDEGSGTRSSLMYETVRIVGRVRPKYVIWENVKNVTGKRHRHNFDEYLNRIGELGYNNYWQVLNAKDYGVAQNRERVFVVSIRTDVDT